MKKIIPVVFAALLVGCSGKESDVRQAETAITTEGLGRHISMLASDDLTGRKPLTPGEEKSINYIRSEFQKTGLEPAFGASYFQEVPLVEITYNPTDLKVQSGKEVFSLKVNKDFVASGQQITEKITLEHSPLVFAGFGIVAPEYEWNDYKDIDVKGKTVIVVVNDPGFFTKDSALFNGNAMTYYGRWTYKYEEAARQGAAGVLIVHEDTAAAYPWSVVETGANTDKLYIDSEDNYMSRCKLEGWLTRAAATALLAKSGQDYEKIKMAACKKDFKAIPLNADISLTMNNTYRKAVSHNAGAMLKGTEKPDECIVYTAHWDHLGIGKAIDGDSIYNGAMDNASGVAALLEIAKAYKLLKDKPACSVLFLSVTSEEAGLLGSHYYVQHPVIPMDKTLANITIDGLGFYGKTKDVQITGYGLSQLDDYVKEAAAAQGRYVIPETHPEYGGFFRSDHLFFAFAGVPVVYLSSGDDLPGMDRAAAHKMIDENFMKKYHKPMDEYHPESDDLSGAVDDTRLMFMIGYKLAKEGRYPLWNENSPYKR